MKNNPNKLTTDRFSLYVSNPLLSYFHSEMLKEACHKANNDMLVGSGVDKWLEENPTTH